LTSLLGGNEAGTGDVGDRMGAPESCEKATLCESWLMLVRGLSCCECGRLDRRRIHETFKEMESRAETSTIMGVLGSPLRSAKDRRLDFALGVENWVLSVLEWCDPLTWSGVEVEVAVEADSKVAVAVDVDVDGAVDGAVEIEVEIEVEACWWCGSGAGCCGGAAAAGGW
jgi:hypothetical protein